MTVLVHWADPDFTIGLSEGIKGRFPLFLDSELVQKRGFGYWSPQSEVNKLTRPCLKIST